MNFDPKKLIIFITLIFLNFIVSSQESLIWEDFESYSNGYNYVSGNGYWSEEGSNNSSVVSSAGNGYNSSDEYLVSGAGWDKLKYNFSVTNGETYQIYFRAQITAGYSNNLKLTVLRLNSWGTADDDTTVASATWSSIVGNSTQNSWETVEINFTANSSDASSINGMELNIFKTWGSGYKIDDFRVSCTSCDNTTYSTGNWSSSTTWGGYSAPSAPQNTIVKHDVTVDASTNNLGNLTVNSGKTLTINSSQIVDVGGIFDATGATISTASSVTFKGQLQLTHSSTDIIKISGDDVTEIGMQAQASTSSPSAGSTISVSSATNATSALTTIDTAIDTIANTRGKFGSAENRIEYRMNVLTNVQIASTLRLSKIEDADFALETAKFTKSQIISKAATSMLAQANASGDVLLRLVT